MQKIRITLEGFAVSAELADTPTAAQIMEALPLEGSVNVWGEEIYFTIPVQADLEPEAREEVEEGDLGYWPSGPAFCIFFGPTPVSTGQKPRAYSPVNVFGRVLGHVKQFKSVQDGSNVRVIKEN
jgi:hypothetical protein